MARSGRIITLGATRLVCVGHAVVKSPASHQVSLLVNQDISSPPVLALSAGWNLVGTALPANTVSLPANELLASLYNVPTSTIPSFTQVVSPSFDSTQVLWAWNNSSPPNLERWRGYLVFMGAADSLAGFSSTPVW